MVRFVGQRRRHGGGLVFSSSSRKSSRTQQDNHNNSGLSHQTQLHTVPISLIIAQLDDQVLDRIFSFTDSETLATSCFYVCRAWCQLLSLTNSAKYERRFRDEFCQPGFIVHDWQQGLRRNVQNAYSPLGSGLVLSLHVNGDFGMFDGEQEELEEEEARDKPMETTWRLRYAVRCWCLQRAREKLARAVSHVLLNTENDSVIRDQLDHPSRIPIFGANKEEWEREWRDQVRALRFREAIQWYGMEEFERIEFTMQMIAQCRQFGQNVGHGGQLREYWQRDQLSYAGQVMGMDVEVEVPKGRPVQVRFDLPGSSSAFDEDEVMGAVSAGGTRGESHRALGEHLSLSFVDEARFIRGHHQPSHLSSPMDTDDK